MPTLTEPVRIVPSDERPGGHIEADPYTAFAMSIIAGSAGDVKAWLNRRDSKTRTKESRAAQLKRLEENAVRSYLWLTGVIEGRVAFAELCGLLGIEHTKFLVTVFSRWPNQQLALLRRLSEEWIAKDRHDARAKGVRMLQNGIDIEDIQCLCH